MMRTGILELWTIQGLNQSLAEGIRFHLKDRKNLNSRVLPHPGSGHFQVKNGRSFDVSLTLCKVDSVLISNRLPNSNLRFPNSSMICKLYNRKQKWRIRSSRGTRT